MTQEQKAQAYDDALEKAKIEINTKGIGETVNLCKQLFPELAESNDEESDDERIRKRLIEYFEGFRMGNAEVRWEGLIVQEVLAWLKKQKETSHISEMCKENANSFADGIIEVRSFQRGMEEGRRLERQKEQKPHTDEEKEYIRTIKSIISDFIRDKKPENLAHYQRIYDWLDGRYVPFSCGHENGKPVDFPTTDEEVKEFLETHPKVEVPEKYKTPDFVSRNRIWQTGDNVILHFGDNNEELVNRHVLYRIISGTEPDKIIVMLDYYE